MKTSSPFPRTQRRTDSSARPAPSVPSPLTSRLRVFAFAVLLVLAAGWCLHGDLKQLRWAVTLSGQGSPSPVVDTTSPSGYADDQRHLLGRVERGETYRWVQAAQSWYATGRTPTTFYLEDNAPTGRPQVLPRLYLTWVGALSYGRHLLTGEPFPLAVESAAGWEPVIAHLLAFFAVSLFAWRAHGPVAGLFAGLVLLAMPGFTGQFVPGTLTARAGAMGYAVAAVLCSVHRSESGRPGWLMPALLAALALWLDPAFGFPAAVISTVVLADTGPASVQNTLLAGALGAVLSLLAWALDGEVWDLAATELRAVHPLYSMAWLGVALLAAAVVLFRQSRGHRRKALVSGLAGAAGVVPLAVAQLSRGYAGWLYSSAALRRVTSLDEEGAYAHVGAWVAGAPPLEIFSLLLPIALAITLLFLAFRTQPAEGGPPPRAAAFALTTVVVLALFHVRWIIPAAVVAVFLVLPQARRLPVAGRCILGGATALLAGFSLLIQAVAPLRHGENESARPADLRAMIHRHFAHWLNRHSGGEPVVALAPPELSDSLVFHGGLRVLLSTAWQSYPGHLAASRVLSAPESSEVEAVVESRDVTHIILPSWDEVTPLLVKPAPEGKDTFHARVNRWKLPLFLKPLPYHLPPTPGYEDQKLTVLKVVPPPDEALSLVWLAEYFLEMKRPEPAGLAARALADAFPDDPNALIARALIASPADPVPPTEIISRVAALDRSTINALPWERRVQRSIVLALARRPIRAELETCVADASREQLLELTPLQAHRLRVLMERAGLTFPDRELQALLAALGAEYAPRSS